MVFSTHGWSTNLSDILQMFVDNVKLVHFAFSHSQIHIYFCVLVCMPPNSSILPVTSVILLWILHALLGRCSASHSLLQLLPPQRHGEHLQDSHFARGCFCLKRPRLAIYCNNLTFNHFPAPNHLCESGINQHHWKPGKRNVVHGIVRKLDPGPLHQSQTIFPLKILWSVLCLHCAHLAPFQFTLGISFNTLLTPSFRSFNKSACNTSLSSKPPSSNLTYQCLSSPFVYNSGSFYPNQSNYQDNYLSNISYMTLYSALLKCNYIGVNCQSYQQN